MNAAKKLCGTDEQRAARVKELITVAIDGGKFRPAQAYLIFGGRGPCGCAIGCAAFATGMKATAGAHEVTEHLMAVGLTALEVDALEMGYEYGDEYGPQVSRNGRARSAPFFDVGKAIRAEYHPEITGRDETP